MISDNDPNYLEQLSRAVLESLGMFKSETDAKRYLEADMWCHFGRAIIRGPNEGNMPVIDSELSQVIHTHKEMNRLLGTAVNK